MKNIIVLGSTGSIGCQTLDVATQHSDELQVVGLAAHRSLEQLCEQGRRFDKAQLIITDESLTTDARLVEQGIVCGYDAITELIWQDDVDLVVNALVGAAGLRASYECLRAGKQLALANKESLVVGGDLLMPLARALNDSLSGAILPIDSEHGAIYQCLLGEDPHEVARLWITASGGPFRGEKRADLTDITPAQALAHPTWNMGAKISIDSSTLMNKGLEVIEAHHLFAMPYDKIKVLVHPQSVIHSMVEYCDASVKAHLGTTDMRIPIQYALSYPKRWKAPVTALDFTQLQKLEFEVPDTETFPCLDLAFYAGKEGGTLPAVMNAANEVAVAAFLEGRCSYLAIVELIRAVMDAHCREGIEQVESIEQLEYYNVWARTQTEVVLAKQ